MPNWKQILAELQSAPSPSDRLRRKYARALSDHTGRNLIVYYSGWQDKFLPNDPNANLFFINDDDKHGFMTVIHELDRSKGLDLMLHTPGGDIAAAESLVVYLKGMFGNDIRAIVPQLAMSAGTMLACACKEIWLAKHSNLGPIDPQFAGLPAHGIVEEFNRAAEEVKKDPSKAAIWQPIIARYHPTLIASCERAIAWSERAVHQWLSSNMFAEYEDSADRATNVIEHLTLQDKTFAHNRHIHIDELKKLGLIVKPIEDNNEFQELVLSTHHAYKISLTSSPAAKIIENQNGISYIRFISAQQHP